MKSNYSLVKGAEPPVHIHCQGNIDQLNQFRSGIIVFDNIFNMLMN